MALSLENTERAFAHKSDVDLSKAYRLFQAFSYPFLVNYGPIIANWTMKIGFPIKSIIKKTIFNQFCGGETIEEIIDLQKGYTIIALGQFLIIQLKVRAQIKILLKPMKN